eukprot:scaffold2835_cov259-Pinguiococcus_pyrenoidosus.AAC.7
MSSSLASSVPSRFFSAGQALDSSRTASLARDFALRRGPFPLGTSCSGRNRRRFQRGSISGVFASFVRTPASALSSHRHQKSGSLWEGRRVGEGTFRISAPPIWRVSPPHRNGRAIPSAVSLRRMESFRVRAPLQREENTRRVWRIVHQSARAITGGSTTSCV